MNGGILFVNHTPSQCGVYEYGKNVYSAVKHSQKYNFIYTECDDFEKLCETVNILRPAAVIYNYYITTMPWLVKPQYTGIGDGGIIFINKAAEFDMPQIGIIHDACQFIADSAVCRRRTVLSPDNLPFSLFDYYISADTTIIPNSIVYKSGRPLLSYSNQYPPPKTPVFSCATLATHNKGLDKIVEYVQNEYDEAEIRFNMPLSDFTPDSRELTQEITDACRGRLYKPGIKLTITHNYLSTEELLDFLSQSTANFYLYENNNPYCGVSSATDNALSVRRPIVVSNSPMFRHITREVPSVCIDNSSIKEIAARGFAPLEELYKKWSPENLLRDYEYIVSDILSKYAPPKRHNPETAFWRARSESNTRDTTHFFIHVSSHAGDVILTRPFIEELRTVYPNALISLECTAKNSYLWEDFGLDIYHYELPGSGADTLFDWYFEPLKPTPNCPCDAVFLNMWFGTFFNPLILFGISYLTLVHIFNMYMKEYKLDHLYRLSPKRKTPFVKFHKKIRLPIPVAKYGVLTENGSVLSMQSDIDLNGCLPELAEAFPDLTFYCSAPPPQGAGAGNIIDCSKMNLLELSELSGRCIALLTRASGVNAASMTEANKYKLRCFAGWTFQIKWRWQLLDNQIFFAADTDAVKHFLRHISKNKDALRRHGMNMRGYTDNAYTVAGITEFRSSIRKYSRNVFCKFLKSIDEIDICRRFLSLNLLPPHNCPPKSWDIAHIISDLSDGNLLDMGASDSDIINCALLMGIPGEKYGIDLRPPTNPFPTVNYLTGDLCETGLPSGYFQNITCLSVIEHGVDISKFCAEVSRLLKQTGKLYVTFDYWEPKVSNNLIMYNLEWNVFDKNDVLSLIEECAKAGLVLAEDVEWGLGSAVITPDYYSGGNISYTFGMLMFTKA